MKKAAKLSGRGAKSVYRSWWTNGGHFVACQDYPDFLTVHWRAQTHSAVALTIHRL
jgi:hypothetical protein